MIETESNRDRQTADSWGRLSNDDLTALGVMNAHPHMSQLSPEIVAWLGTNIHDEVGFRTEFKANKFRQIPVEDWTDRQLYGAYLACLALETGSSAMPVLNEWVVLIRLTIVSSSFARLELKGVSHGN